MELKKISCKDIRTAILAAELRLKEFVRKNCHIDLDEHFMFDIMVKRIHEYKRQL